MINSTDKDKDILGSLLMDKELFLENGWVWEINYRGELDFMHQVDAQKRTINLKVEDGWTKVIFQVHFILNDI